MTGPAQDGSRHHGRAKCLRPGVDAPKWLRFGQPGPGTARARWQRKQVGPARAIPSLMIGTADCGSDVIDEAACVGASPWI